MIQTASGRTCGQKVTNVLRIPGELPTPMCTRHKNIISKNVAERFVSAMDKSGYLKSGEMKDFPTDEDLGLA